MLVTSPAGTLRRAENVHVNRGGEIEKRKAFVPWATLPGLTRGLGAANGVLYVWSTQSLTSPRAELVIQRVSAPSGAPDVLRVWDSVPFGGNIFASVQFTNGNINHFFGGTRVTDYGDFAPSLPNAAFVLLPFRTNMYAARSSILFRSRINDATLWGTAQTGSALFDMATQAYGSEAITGLGNYGGEMAVFARRTVQIWQFSADPQQSQQRQILRGVGCVAYRSIVSHADMDVLFLSDSGVRSLRARDSSNSAATADVGTPIDEDLVATLRGLTFDQQRDSILSVLDPVDGRYWLAIGNRIWVFSHFPASRISAWSTYELPWPVEGMVAVDDKVFVRSGDTIYRYGGENGNTYDSSPAVVETAFLDGRQLAQGKTWRGMDIAAEGSWDTYIAFNPDLPDEEDRIGVLDRTTVHRLDTPTLGNSPMAKLRFVSQGSGAAKLGQILVHYDGSDNR